jgi:hypothetical protein
MQQPCLASLTTATFSTQQINILLTQFFKCLFVHRTSRLSYNKKVRYTKKPVIKIGALGNYPTKPRQQIKDDLKPPDRHRFKKNDRLILDSLVKICSGNTVEIGSGKNTTTRHNYVSLTTSTATGQCASSTSRPTGGACISTPEKAALLMEIIGGMKTPEKLPVMRKLVSSSACIAIESLNNQSKKFVHIPVCANEVSALVKLRKYIRW